MNNEYYNNFQYDSCVSRGICSISPRISALQTVLILYLRLFAKYSIKLELNSTIKDFLLNTIAITIYNPEFNENSFHFAVKKFREELPKLIEKFYKSKLRQNAKGSGLGLSIAKNLTKSMGGEFKLQLDGDLFKAVLIFDVME